MSSAIERNGKLLTEGFLSDVTFIVGKDGKRINAHKCILSMASPVFRGMFEAKNVADNDEIQLSDVTNEAFQEFLKFIYTDKVTISEEVWAPIIYLSDTFDIPDLKDKCQSFVHRTCNGSNVCGFYNTASKQDVLGLAPNIKNFFINKGEEALNSDSFLAIQDKKILTNLLSLDELSCREIDIFRAAVRWATANKKKTYNNLLKALGPALYAIRFHRMADHDEFIDEFVVQKGLLTKEEYHEACNGKLLEKKPSFVYCPSHSRMKICFRFSKIHPRECTFTRYQAVKFQTDTKVEVTGYGIYGSRDHYCNVKYSLKSFNDKEVLGEASGFVRDGGGILSPFIFEEPIEINPNTVYVAILEFRLGYNYFKHGMEGVSSRTVDGVRWTFESDPTCYETSVDGGQIPEIYFTKL